MAPFLPRAVGKKVIKVGIEKAATFQPPCSGREVLGRIEIRYNQKKREE